MWSTIGGLPLLLDDGDHTYLYGPSLTPVAQVDGSGTVQYLHGDLLGSVRTVTDASGAVVGASTFDAFGSRTAHTGAGDSLFGFTGNWTDPDTHLVHLRARDYDPVTGQFLTVDPAVDSTKQPYAYTGNSPLSRTDPSGLDWIQDIYDGAVDALMAAAQASNCFLEQATAFGAGALDSLTFGASSIILGAVVPGYDDFVAGHEAAFTAGSVTVTVIQIAIAVVTTAGVGIALIAAKVVAKAALKKADDVAAGAVRKYEVGLFKDLKARSSVGDDLDIHHVPQSHPAQQSVSGYTRADAPSIALPREEHAAIPVLRGTYSGTPSELLAQEVAHLGEHTLAPQSAIDGLIGLVRRTYPGVF